MRECGVFRKFFGLFKNSVSSELVKMKLYHLKRYFFINLIRTIVIKVLNFRFAIK